MKKLKASGTHVPSLDAVPVLDPNVGIFWRAWEVLTKKRLINQSGPQPIMIAEVLAYANLARIEDPDDREDLMYFIGELDSIWLSHEYARRAAEERKAAQKARRKRGRR